MKKSYFVFGIVLFLTCSLMIQAQTIPKPEDILGFKVGADYHLATYDQAIQYWRILEKNSPRLQLFSAGKTSMGQDMIYAVISSEKNIAELDKYKTILRRLSLAQGLSPEEAKKLAQEGKAIVYIDGGLHASECAPAQHNIQLAYDLAVAQDEKTSEILDKVILVLVFANPDGMNILAEWYQQNLNTPYEVSPLPRLYHIYAGHDNNRDSYLANLVETQNIARLVNKEWFPVIFYNHHQTAPFPARIWIPPNSEPTNPNVHPLIIRWQNLVGSAMGAAFDEEGKEGAISRHLFDTWYPGYLTQVQDSHNIISILTETALYRYATPHFYTLRDFPPEYQDLTMSAFYPSPWKGGWWRLKDAVDYCLTASKAVLQTAAKYKEELLLNKYRMGKDIIERFQKEPPYAWIIPPKQADPQSVSLLLNRMILLGVDVYQSLEPFTCDGLSYPAGTYIIPMTQPFALFIKNVFEEQKYPDLRQYPDLWQGLVNPIDFEGAPFESYDMMGWTLPYQFGADVRVANTPISPQMEKVDEVHLKKGKLPAKMGLGFVLSPQQNASAAAINRLLKSGVTIYRLAQKTTINSKTLASGTIIIPSRQVRTPFWKKLVADWDLTPEVINQKPKVKLLKINPVRVGIYQSWVPSADEGWTRYILDMYEFSYKILHDADIRAGLLEKNYDVIILPDTWRPEIIIEGHKKGTMPPQYVGGIGAKGLQNLKKFAAQGGTLIFFNSTCNLAIKSFGIPVKNVMEKVKRGEFTCTGSILRIEFDSDHPLAFGMPSQAGGIFDNSCAFITLPTFKDDAQPRSVARYARENLLMSGYIYGESFIKGKSSIMEVPYQKGKLILFGFPIQYRAQPYGTFKLLFNAIYSAKLRPASW